jgi:hypothetical protein
VAASPVRAIPRAIVVRDISDSFLRAAQAARRGEGG